MLIPEVVVLDFEGFRHKKSGFIIKELSICSNNFSDTIFFLQPVSYNPLSVRENLIRWSANFCTVCRRIVATILTGLYLKFSLQLNFDFLQESFMLKGKRIQNHCKQLQKEVIDLNTLLCPKVEEIVTPIKHFTCALHSLYMPEKQKKIHCAKRNAQLYFYWLTLPANEPSSGESSSFSSSGEFISKFDSIELHNE